MRSIATSHSRTEMLRGARNTYGEVVRRSKEAQRGRLRLKRGRTRVLPSRPAPIGI
jgi:hypothetical protein